jgi:ABC-type branched-subunit amino acid transport system ATPase component
MNHNLQEGQLIALYGFAQVRTDSAVIAAYLANE